MLENDNDSDFNILFSMSYIHNTYKVKMYSVQNQKYWTYWIKLSSHYSLTNNFEIESETSDWSCGDLPFINTWEYNHIHFTFHYLEWIHNNRGCKQSIGFKQARRRKAPTRAFSWLKAPLVFSHLRHYFFIGIDMKLGGRPSLMIFVSVCQFHVYLLCLGAHLA